METGAKHKQRDGMKEGVDQWPSTREEHIKTSKRPTLPLHTSSVSATISDHIFTNILTEHYTFSEEKNWEAKSHKNLKSYQVSNPKNLKSQKQLHLPSFLYRKFPCRQWEKGEKPYYRLTLSNLVSQTVFGVFPCSFFCSSFIGFMLRPWPSLLMALHSSWAFILLVLR